MIDQLYAHAPYVAFIALMAVLGVVMTVAAIADARRNHRSPR